MLCYPKLFSIRGFASAAGGDKARVFFGLTRQYSLRDRRIKSGPPQPRKLPFHRIGVAPPGTKYFCRDFQNPTTSVSNASFTIEYRPFVDIDLMEKTKLALTRTLPGCTVYTTAVEPEASSFRITRGIDGQVLFEKAAPSHEATLEDLRTLVTSATRY